MILVPTILALHRIEPLLVIRSGHICPAVVPLLVLVYKSHFSAFHCRILHLFLDIGLISAGGLVRDSHGDQVTLKRRDQVEFSEVGAGL